jgi:hypothetical protein
MSKNELTAMGEVAEERKKRLQEDEEVLPSFIKTYLLLYFPH